MLQAANIALAYGKRVIFKDVNIKFTHGNCYGLIGADGTGKSTFLRILAGQKEPDKGEVSIVPKERIAVLQQDQFVYDEETVLNTVIRGHKRLYDVKLECEALYAKGELTEEEGMRCGDLEGNKQGQSKITKNYAFKVISRLQGASMVSFALSVCPCVSFVVRDRLIKVNCIKRLRATKMACRRTPRRAAGDGGAQRKLSPL